jgi:hypothetical protein
MRVREEGVTEASPLPGPPPPAQLENDLTCLAGELHEMCPDAEFCRAKRAGFHSY